MSEPTGRDCFAAFVREDIKRVILESLDARVSKGGPGKAMTPKEAAEYYRYQDA